MALIEQRMVGDLLLILYVCLNQTQATGDAQPCVVTRYLEALSRDGRLTKEERHNVREMAHQIVLGASMRLISAGIYK